MGCKTGKGKEKNGDKTMKSCLDCLHCKLKGERLNCKGGHKGGQWINRDGVSVVDVHYSEKNIKLAQHGNSRYLNHNQRCELFFDMED